MKLTVERTDYLEKEVKFLERITSKFDRYIYDQELIENGEAYLILEAFTSYFRLSNSLPEIDAQLRDRVNNVLSNFDKLINEERIRQVELFLNQKFFKNLENLLNNVCVESENIILLEDLKPSSQSEDSIDAALEFIDIMSGLVSLIRFLELKNYPTNPSIIKNFKEIEDKFKSKFFHFRIVEKILEEKREIYRPDKKEWWFYQSPSEYPIEFVIPNVKLKESTIPTSCPSYEDIVKYAFDEFEYDDVLKFEEHLLTCDKCFEEVFALRHAQSMIPDEPQFKAIPMKYRIKEIIEKLKKLFEEVTVKILRPEDLKPSFAVRGASISGTSRFYLGVTRTPSLVSFLSWNLLEIIRQHFKEKDIPDIKLSQFNLLKVKPVNGKIQLLDYEKLDNELKLLCDLIQLRGKFYFKVLSIMNEQIIELSTGEAEHLPIEVKATDSPLIFLIIGFDRMKFIHQSMSFITLLQKLIKSEDIKKEDIEKINELIILLFHIN